MLIYENEEHYNNYVAELKKEISHNRWEEYMNNRDYPLLYFKKRTTPDDQKYKMINRYYSEIPIEYITSCNTTNARRNIFKHQKFKIVVDSIDQIIQNTCRPLCVRKYKDEYHIVDGKHRFYAHVLMNRTTVPVSVEEMVELEDFSSGEVNVLNNALSKQNMISINMPYTNEGNQIIIWPEKALEFYEKYSCLFDNIYSVKMTTKYEQKLSKLELFFRDGNSIVFSDCCTAGNRFRSSEVTCELLNRCNYNVDINFISSNSNFQLIDGRDAHNMNFNVSPNWEILKKEIIPNLHKKKRYDANSNYDTDNSLLLKYISKHNDFKTGPAANSYEFYNSYSLQTDSMYYHLIGANDIYNIEHIYIFSDRSLPFNNMTIQFLGVINSDSDLFKLITKS